MLALLSFSRRQVFDFLVNDRKCESPFVPNLFDGEPGESARTPGTVDLYLRTGTKIHLFKRTGLAASYRMLADSPRRVHARPNLLSARVTLPIPAGSSTAEAQPCLHDSAKYSSKTA